MPITPEKREGAVRAERVTPIPLAEEGFRLLVESVRDYAIFMLDATGHVQTWNAGAERIKGYRAEEIIGRHFSIFYPEEDIRAGKLEMELEGAERDGRFEDEAWRVRKDGTMFWANVVLTALRGPDGRLVGFAKVTRDLTERKRAEEQRLALAQADEAIRLRDEFLSIASHELRTPLTVLQLQLQRLEEKLGSDPKLASQIARATRNGDRLADLIETLLDVSRISTGRLELKRTRFDLAEAVREVRDRFVDGRRQGEAIAIAIEADEGLVGPWDRLRIEQVVTNLLSNAVKYGEGKPIHVRVRRRGPEAELVVEDSGPGIPPQDLTRIFERFERSASTRHYSGLGLGLFVAREIAHAHGGSIGASNRPEGGARLEVRLPLRASSEAAPVSGSEPP